MTLTSFQGFRKENSVLKWVCERGTFYSIEGIRQNYLFCLNDKGKGLNLRVEPPRIKLCSLTPPPPLTQ